MAARPAGQLQKNISVLAGSSKINCCFQQKNYEHSLRPCHPAKKSARAPPRRWKQSHEPVPAKKNAGSSENQLQQKHFRPSKKLNMQVPAKNAAGRSKNYRSFQHPCCPVPTRSPSPLTGSSKTTIAAKNQKNPLVAKE